MALIKCAECGKEFSDKASACPNCACPVEEAYEQEEKKKTNKQNVKSYNELTGEEKASIRLYMRGKSSMPTSQIVLYALGFGCVILGTFFAFWFFFWVVGLCLVISGGIIQTENEKKFYYKHPKSANEKLDIVKQNRKNARKQLPLMIIGVLCFGIGISTGFMITDNDFEFIAPVLIVIGIICYALSIYKMVKNTKK